MILPSTALHRVPFDGSFRIATTRTEPPRNDKDGYDARLEAASREMDDLHRILMAGNRHALLIVFQAMDAAGKDGTIRAVLQGINPAGCEVYSFKKPSRLQLDHDFLWRTSRRLPERGRIGIFNRSQYEEVLVVRVHPEILDGQQLPPAAITDAIWEERFESIRDQEKHLARNGTVIIKFWLNVSREQQRRRFLRRLDNPDKIWKFEPADVAESEYWDEYMAAYEAALNATSRPWAPWYAIPADDKRYMRAVVAETIVQTLHDIGLEYPQPSEEVLKRYAEIRARLT